LEIDEHDALRYGNKRSDILNLAYQMLEAKKPVLLQKSVLLSGISFTSILQVKLHKDDVMEEITPIFVIIMKSMKMIVLVDL
jgi:hypothetical protein